MPDAIFSQTLRDTLELNRRLRKRIEDELEKHQGRFVVTRDDLAAVGQQLMTLEYLATNAEYLAKKAIERQMDQAREKDPDSCDPV